MKLNSISPGAGSKKPRLRVGRGASAGQGKTCGRGVKGQRARKAEPLLLPNGKMLRRLCQAIFYFIPQRGLSKCFLGTLRQLPSRMLL